MDNWQKITLLESAPIIDVIKIIEQGGVQIAFVVDEQGRLKGAVTDGDLRRGLLRGVNLQESVHRIMNPSPYVVRANADKDEVLQLMKSRVIKQVPVVDEQGKIQDVILYDQLVENNGETPSGPEPLIVVMAGGEGKRLWPLTQNVPKPMLKVGEKPILETVLNHLVTSGFGQFFFSVNYKAEAIKGYFEDGSRWGARIHYLHEEESLGTAGALNLLPERPNRTTIVINGDVLTKVNFSRLLRFHSKRSAMATMCVKEYDLQVPYGVVQLEREEIVAIDEKPAKRFFVNAGIYVLEPEVFDIIGAEKNLDMPSVFHMLRAEGKKTIAFPIHEYWMDVGRLTDFNRASREYGEVFK